MRRVACARGAGRSAACPEWQKMPVSCATSVCGRRRPWSSPGAVRDTANRVLGAACRCDNSPSMRPYHSGTAGPGRSRRIKCWPLTSTKENNDDQMASAAIDRQVRAQVEL